MRLESAVFVFTGRVGFRGMPGASMNANAKDVK
jgi:hypothetical protein